MEWQTTIKHLYQKSLLAFGVCDLCGNNTTKYPLLCTSCFKQLPLFNQRIIQGDLLNWPAINRALPNIYFDKLFAISPYQSPFNRWLTEFKYSGRFELANLFVHLLYEQWKRINKGDIQQKNKEIDLILSVPLHTSKWQLRGYNQSHLIAKKLAKKLEVPYQADAIKRVRKNVAQVGQTGSQRRHNLQDAFALTDAFPNHCQHVMLIDDVVTTGSTASEISKLLKKTGVNSVTLATLCLSLPK